MAWGKDSKKVKSVETMTIWHLKSQTEIELSPDHGEASHKRTAGRARF